MWPHKLLKKQDTRYVKALRFVYTSFILICRPTKVETCPRVLDPNELKNKIRDVHIIGIRSKTKLPKEILDEAQNLLVIGCFCIDTTQVDLDAAASKGVSNFLLLLLHAWILILFYRLLFSTLLSAIHDLWQN